MKYYDTEPHNGWVPSIFEVDQQHKIQWEQVLRNSRVRPAPTFKKQNNLPEIVLWVLIGTGLGIILGYFLR